MNESPLLRTLIRDERLVLALREPSGPVRVEWGSRNGTWPLHKFHAPRAMAPSIWQDFPDAGLPAPAQSAELAVEDLEHAPPIPRPVAAIEASRESWNELCARAEEELRTERFRKLVPARSESLALSPGEYDSILGALAGRLFAAPMEQVYRFLLKSGPSVFFGATPELLFRREGRGLYVPAIAGTRALGPGLDEAALGLELLESAKERAEHAWVVEGICEALRSLGLEPHAEAAPTVLRVPRLLHLYTPITVPDCGSLPSERILAALHPTPAIGGFPRAAARDFLFAHEGWDRGLFSAPLLFSRPGKDLCLVAIRSALLTPTRLYFFAGAGFVRGSTAEGEWRESEKKMRVMQTLLFGEIPDAT